MLSRTSSMLLSVSHYGILASGGNRQDEKFRSFVRMDLDDIVAAGFNGIEGPWINASWIGGGGYEVFSPNGPAINQWALERLDFVIDQADERGLFVAPRGSVSEDAGPTWRMAKQWERLTQLLRGRDNVIFDVANEFDSKRPAHEIATLLAAVRIEDKNRHVTASVSGPVDYQLGRLWMVWREWKHKTVEPMTYLAPHFFRDREWCQREFDAVRSYTSIQQSIPVYCEEPHRRGYDASGHAKPEAWEFLQAAAAARRAGAVAWCFHNGHFDTREKRLIAQLDGEERKVMASLREAVS